MLYELILINEIEQRAKIFFLSVDTVLITFTWEYIAASFQKITFSLLYSS